MDQTFKLEFIDYFCFALYIIAFCWIAWWFGRKARNATENYFLAGRTLPWFIVGASFLAANISSEHFIGTVGAAYVYGMCIAQWEWGNIAAFTVLIFVFVPFLLRTRIFTAPEFLERRFNGFMRQFFAVVTVITDIMVFLAAVLYTGGLALHSLFHWNLWFSIFALALVAGSFAIYGGMHSVAWADSFTTLVFIVGGATVSFLGVASLSDTGSFIEGLHRMIDLNRAQSGVWADAVKATAEHIVGRPDYNRLAIIQPASHAILPWPSLLFGFLTISIWYNVINQHMTQRVLSSRSPWDARMGIVFAGFLKVLMPFLIVVPGLVMFAKNPQVLLMPWDKIRSQADHTYINMIQSLLPVGVRGLFLATLFGAIQANMNSVLNSTATIITLDFYKRWINKAANEKQLVRFGVICSSLVLCIAVIMACFINRLGDGVFVYVNVLYAFFAPPFGAVFILGILYKRINGTGASAAVVFGFLFGVALKIYVEHAAHPLPILVPFGNQAILNWFCCICVCLIVSLCSRPPRPEQVTDDLTLNWKKLDILQGLGGTWYRSVIFWWIIFALLVFSLITIFSGFLI